MAHYHGSAEVINDHSLMLFPLMRESLTVVREYMSFLFSNNCNVLPAKRAAIATIFLDVWAFERSIYQVTKDIEHTYL